MRVDSSCWRSNTLGPAARFRSILRPAWVPVRSPLELARLSDDAAAAAGLSDLEPSDAPEGVREYTVSREIRHVGVDYSVCRFVVFIFFFVAECVLVDASLAICDLAQWVVCRFSCAGRI